MQNIDNAKDVTVGVVGLGLMGSSIIASLLIAGHRVIAIAPIPEDMPGSYERIRQQLTHGEQSDLLTLPIDTYMSRLTISENYSLLKGCLLVIECVTEVLEIKMTVYNKIEAVVSKNIAIASNTSAIPISTLQNLFADPHRFLGIHWAEPAYMTRFLEVTCGEKTDMRYAEWVINLARLWGKEPTLLKKDIRGFITNRLMYAVYREGLSLIQNGDASMEDVDKAFRYDAGSWMTLMGIFRRMDFLGLQDTLKILETVYPQLNNDETVPDVMQKMVDNHARGIHNLQGLFDYTPEEGKLWENAFSKFNEDIFKLAAKYPANLSSEK